MTDARPNSKAGEAAPRGVFSSGVARGCADWRCHFRALCYRGARFLRHESVDEGLVAGAAQLRRSCIDGSER